MALNSVPNVPTIIAPSNGNTEHSPGPCYRYFFTCKVLDCSNYEIEQKGLHTSLVPICKKFIFQLEKGEGGFYHFQGSINLIKKKRLSEVKSYIGINYIHLEATRNEKAAMKYCCKADTRIAGPWIYPTIEENYKKISIEKFYDWQQEILDTIKSADKFDRKIYWYYSRIGNNGKSTFCTWLLDHKYNNYNYLIIDEGNKSDLLFCFTGGKKPPTNFKPADVVLIDLSRDAMNNLNYNVLETLKNGRCFSSKYERRMCRFDPPLILCFSNNEPKYHKLSKDRWNVKCLDNNNVDIQDDLY